MKIRFWNGFRGLTIEEANEAEKPGGEEFVIEVGLVQLTYGEHLKLYGPEGEWMPLAESCAWEDGWLRIGDVLYGDISIEE